MPIQFSSYTNQVQAVLSPDPFFNISRAVTRLKDIFVSFYGPVYDVAVDGGDTAAQAIALRSAYTKQVNYFKHPSFTKDEVELQLYIGSKIYPDFPIQSSSEFFIVSSAV